MSVWPVSRGQYCHPECLRRIHLILSEYMGNKEKNCYVYITTNHNDRVMYIGVTSNLEKRIYEHKQGLQEGFTKKYYVDKLVYYEHSNSIESAIIREKQLKGWLRKKKNLLVESMNPDWKDLSKNF